MNSRLALLPLLVAAAFACAADETAPAQPDSSVELQQVEVRGTNKSFRSFSIASDGDLRDRVNLGLLGKANAFTAPVTVVNYDEKAINDKAARNLVDVVAKTDASTMSFGGETNTLNGLYVRGQQLDARQFSVNGLAGMYSYQSSPTAAVGSAQLIKGASSAINGMDPEGAVSGSVNIETKKATDTPINTVGIGYFSDSRAQGSFDFGRRFGTDQKWGARINGKLRNGDTPRDGYKEDNKEFALNADYRGEQLRVAIDSMYSKRKTTGGRGRVQDIQFLNFRLPAAPDGKTNLVPDWQGQTTRDQTNMLTFEYDAHDKVQLSGGIGYNHSRYYGNFAQINAGTINRNTGRITTLIEPNGDYYLGANRNNGSRLSDQTSKTFSINLGARGEFETGPVTHTWSTAYDRVRRSRLNYWGSDYTNSIRTNFYNPDFSSGTRTLAPLAATPSVNATYVANSLALSDTLGLSDGKYRLTLGGRMQWIKQEDKTETPVSKGSAHRFSPMLMAAWRPQQDTVVYGNYMEDLEPGAIDADSGTMADPRVSRQFEVGVRKNWGNVVTALNAFQITRPGYWRTTGAAQGKERSRGIEFNTYANLLDKTLRPSFGIMYLRPDLKNYPTYTDTLVNGTQVASPRIIAKAGIEWDTPWVKGLTLNSHAQYYGKSYQDTQKQYSFPSYTLFDVGASYAAKVGKNKLTVSGSVENLFNKNYWQVQRGQYDRSFAVVGMPRTYWLKAEYAF
ncbi:TonB-dependent siderophore receptor [Neisseria sp.]|uniref:TonB-dependent siderophore receptor n=1 Tax=Neisseria sp. TaxID=192066 RepID=UPI0035A08F55